MFGFLLHRDGVARAHVVGWDINAFSVHKDVSVADQLTSGASRVAQSEAKNDVIKTLFKKLEKDITSDAAAASGLCEVAAELFLEHAVLDTELLLFSESHGIFGLLGTASPALAAMGTWRVVTALERLREAKERHAETAANLVGGSGVSCHWKKWGKIRRGVP